MDQPEISAKPPETFFLSYLDDALCAHNAPLRDKVLEMDTEVAIKTIAAEYSVPAPTDQHDGPGFERLLVAIVSRAPEPTTAIEFSQCLPNGRFKKVLIDRGPAMFAKAQAIKDAGYRLESKALDGDSVCVAIADGGADEFIASRVVHNGPAVPHAVDEMINEVHKWLVTAKKSTIVGVN